MRSTSGSVKCNWYTCVKLRERSRDVCCYCSYMITLVTVMHWSVFRMLVLVFCACVYTLYFLLVWLYCIPSTSIMYFSFLLLFLFVCATWSPVSNFLSSDHLFQGQLFSRLTREWYRRLLPRSISSKWSKGEFALLTFPCTVAVLTFNCLSVFRANSYLVLDNCAIPGLLRLACHSLRHHLKQPLNA